MSTTKRAMQDVVIDPEAQSETIFPCGGSLYQPDNESHKSNEEDRLRSYHDSQGTRQGKEPLVPQGRLRVQRRQVLPMTGQMIEVLWGIKSGQNTHADSEWKPPKWHRGRSSRSDGAKKCWWPAAITAVNADGRLSIRYANTLTGYDSSDLEETVHEVTLFGERRLRHGSGIYNRMVARWRFCLWDSEYISESDDCSTAEEDGQGNLNTESHTECKSALVQVSAKLQQLESKLITLQTAVGGLSDLSSNNKTSLRGEILLERLTSVLRAYVFSTLYVDVIANSAKIRKLIQQQYAISEEGAVSSGEKKFGEMDCTLSEFLLLCRRASRDVQEGVRVLPCVFKTSFLNLRSRDTIRLVFESFAGFCKALGIPSECTDGLTVGATRCSSSRSTYGLRCVGFNISRKVGEMSESTLVLGAGSTILRSASTTNIYVIHRPLSKWNMREQRFETSYALECVPIRELRSKYVQEHCGESENEDMEQNEQKGDFAEFEICLEWKQKQVVMHNAYSAATFADDILGSVIIRSPCVEFRTKRLCQSVERLLLELVSKMHNAQTK